MNTKYKTFLGALFVFAFVATQPVSLSAQETKVGYTNIELILNFVPETKTIDATIKELENTLIQKLETKQKNYQLEVETYMQKKQANLLSPEQATSGEAKLTKLKAEIQQDIESADQEVYNKRMTLLGPLQQKMQDAINAVAKEGGYTYILNNVSGGGVPSILYGLESINLTKQIASKLGVTIPETPADK